jgi:hypothetical protein
MTDCESKISELQSRIASLEQELSEEKTAAQTWKEAAEYHLKRYEASLEAEQKWVSVEDRLPNKKEIADNWKFLIANEKDDWTDAAYFLKGKWNNGECEIRITHWMPLPTLPTPPTLSPKDSKTDV